MSSKNMAVSIRLFLESPCHICKDVTIKCVRDYGRCKKHKQYMRSPNFLLEREYTKKYAEYIIYATLNNARLFGLSDNQTAREILRALLGKKTRC